MSSTVETIPTLADLKAMHERIKTAEQELATLQGSVLSLSDALKRERSKALLNGSETPKDSKALIADRRRLDELKEHLPGMREEMHRAVSEVKAVAATRWKAVADDLDATATEQAGAKLREILPLFKQLSVIIGEVRAAAMLTEGSVLRAAFLNSMENPMSPAPGLSIVGTMIMQTIEHLNSHDDAGAIDALAAMEDIYGKFEKGN